MNKKGFMMAELIVVSSIVLVTLVGLYTSYNKIYSIYKTRITYYDVATLYRLGYYRDVLIEDKVDDDTTRLDKVKNSVKGSTIIEVYNSINKEDSELYIPLDDKLNNVADRVFMVYNNKTAINSNIFDGIDDIHVTFSEYIDYLSGAIDFSKFSYMMIMERCNIKEDGNVDEDDCNYAYLEIF